MDKTQVTLDEVEVMLTASEVTGEEQITFDGVEVKISASESEGRPPSFSMMPIYSGGLLVVDGFDLPVVLDLSPGNQIDVKASLPALREHDPNRIVGHTTSVVSDGSQIKVTGLVSGVGKDAEEVRATGANGYPWQSSVGVGVRKKRLLPQGRSAVVNGRNVSGPVYIATQWRLREASFVNWGADPKAVAHVSAKEAKRNKTMDELDTMLATLGLERSSLSEDQLKAFQAQLDAKAKASENDTKTEEEAVKASETTEATIEEQVRAATAKVIADTMVVQNRFRDAPELAQRALAEGWDTGRQEAELRAAELQRQIQNRPTDINTFFVKTDGRDEPLPTEQVIEAAMAINCGVRPEHLEKPASLFENASLELQLEASGRVSSLDRRVIDYAMSREMRGMGMQEAMIHFATGRTRSNRWNGEETIRAAFSTADLQNTFRNTMERILLSEYAKLEPDWRVYCQVSSTKDFRTVDRFRIGGWGHWEQVGQDGELKLGQPVEQPTWTNRLQTIGQINGITRQDIINDDLGALTDIPTKMARYGNLAPEMAFWRRLLDNQITPSGGAPEAFFSVAENSLLTAAPFGESALERAIIYFRTKKDPLVNDKDKRRPNEGKSASYLSIRPSIVLVPPQLEWAAQKLVGAPMLMSGGGEAAGTRVSPVNPAFQLLNVRSSVYLQDTAFHPSASADSYYIASDDATVPWMDMMFLKGKQMPTIEAADVDFNKLGMQVRGYFDFGVAFAERVGIVRCDP